MAAKTDKINALADSLLSDCRTVTGHLADREARFLTILAVCLRGEGVILEIGSYKGKSTVILAKADATAGGRGVVAIDPLTSPASTDPSLDGARSCREEFFGNLDRFHVRERVEFHERFSQDVAETWSRPIRLLWIDGDHTFEGATADFENFSPYLVDGGVIAFHDIMHWSGATRVFIERVLRSGLFGAIGIVGSIGWAQRRAPDATNHDSGHRERLARGLERWVRAKEGGGSGINKTLCKLLRSRVPHASLSAKVFLRLIDDRVPQTVGGA